MEATEKIELFSKVNSVLDKIRPYLVADGGDITLLDVTDDMIVKVKLLGACGSCPMSIQTLKAGVEYSLKSMIPEIKEVMDVKDTSNVGY
ncbi:MAG: NifU family protein [Bacteroidia bacterium]|nr:NifU family protein [Bacteroidia bacterium]